MGKKTTGVIVDLDKFIELEINRNNDTLKHISEIQIKRDFVGLPTSAEQWASMPYLYTMEEQLRSWRKRLNIASPSLTNRSELKRLKQSIESEMAMYRATRDMCMNSQNYILAMQCEARSKACLLVSGHLDELLKATKSK